MNGYGPRGHFLFAILGGAIWLLCVAAAFAILFFIIRFAVLSAMKAHTTWADTRPAAVHAVSFAPAAPPAAPAVAPVQPAPEVPAPGPAAEAPPKPPKPPKKS